LDTLPFEGPNYVQGDGARLPFENDSFDLVISIDALEHIPPDRRAGFLEEQLRTSRDYVLLAAPFEDENISLAEQIVNEFFIKKIGHPNHSLEEHFANGLPSLNETLDFLDQHGIQHLELPNGYLYNWLVMMMALPAAQALPNPEELVAMINRFYNQNLYTSDNRRPCYRTVILSSQQHSLDRDFIAGKYERAEADVPADAQLKLADLLLNLKLEKPRLAALEDELEKRDGYIEKLQGEFEERTEWALELREEVAERDRRVVELQDELGERTEWATKLQKETQEKGQRIVELQDELEERTGWAHGLEDDLEKLREDFEERTDWALRLRDEAGERDRRILSLRDELEVQTQWALQLLEELEQKDQYLSKLQGEFEERTEWALQLDEALTRIRQSWYYRLFGKLEIRK